MATENITSYLAKVKIEIVHQDTDKTKWVSKTYLINAVSITDVEVKLAEYFNKNSFNYVISDVKVSKIEDVIE